MCKPGSASSGGGAASAGLGLAVVVLGAVALVSMAAAVISSILTAVLVDPDRRRRRRERLAGGPALPDAGRDGPAAGFRQRPGRRPGAGPRSSLPGPGRPSAAAARTAIPDRQPLAIEAPAPVPARIGVPAGYGGRAMARLTAYWPLDVDGSPVPDLLLPVDVDGSPVPGLLLPPDRGEAPTARAEDVVTTR